MPNFAVKIVCSRLLMRNLGLREAVKWYNLKKQGLGSDFLYEVKQTISRLKKFPEIAQIRYYTIQTATVETFPY